MDHLLLLLSDDTIRMSDFLMVSLEKNDIFLVISYFLKKCQFWNTYNVMITSERNKSK